MTVHSNHKSKTTHTVHVELGPRSYDILIQPGAFSHLVEQLAEWRRSPAPGTALVVTDSNLVDNLARPLLTQLQEARWKANLHTIPAGESSKCSAVITSMYDSLVDMQADRNTLVIAVGGGVVGDAAGFAAATYNRGLPFVQVPTSLLAMVDSSVGGKVGINHPKGKNLIGAFHQPLGVLIDPSALTSLSDREFRSGLAEVVKYGVILDADFFHYLETNIDAINQREPAVLAHVISRSCRLKADIVEQDERETTGLRAILNYGHTFGHAYEALAGYGTLTHGEAVAIGMIDASRLAERRGLIGSESTERQIRLLRALHLPTTLPEGVSFSVADIIGRMRLDKKNAEGKLRFILPTRIGQVKLFNDTPESDVTAVLAGG